MSLTVELPEAVEEAIRADGREPAEVLLDMLESHKLRTGPPGVIPARRPTYYAADHAEPLEDVEIKSPPRPVVGTGTIRFGGVRPHRPPVVPDDEEVLEDLDYVPPPHPVVGKMTVTFGAVRPHLPPRVPDEE
jgi:hypothetical protein